MTEMMHISITSSADLQCLVCISVAMILSMKLVTLSERSVIESEHLYHIMAPCGVSLEAFAE